MTYIMSDLLKIKDKEINVGDLDEKINELYNGYFKSIGFLKDNYRVYQCNDQFIKIKFLLTKRNKVNRLNTVKIIGIEAV